MLYDRVMEIHVEFFGVARLRANQASIVLHGADGEVANGEGNRAGLPLQQVLALLEQRLPQFAESCLKDGSLRQEYAINCDGQRFVRDPQTLIPAGSTLLILSADAGG